MNLEVVRALLPVAAALFVFCTVLPVFRLFTKVGSIAFLGLALNAAGEKRELIWIALGERVACAIILALPILCLSEMVCTAARNIDLLRGTLWAEQMAQEERVSPLEGAALLGLAVCLLESDQRFVVLEVLLSQGTPSLPAVKDVVGELGAAFEAGGQFLVPYLLSVISLECTQGLLHRVCRRGQFDLSALKLLLPFFFLRVVS